MIHFDNEPISAEAQAVMEQALEQYPCDDHRTWRTSSLLLGCRAQWITPESVGEAQPYFDRDRRLAVAADAILDNRAELIERLGIRDRGGAGQAADSELILLAYERWEEDAPKQLIGDFAFVIWDERRRQLFGARDFSGSRTLYYSRRNQRAAFCTALNPLLGFSSASAGTGNRLNEEWIAEYLANPGVSEIADGATVHRGIEQLPPAHTVTISENGVRLTRYCRLLEEVKPLRLKDDREYEEAFRDVFQTAVDARLRTYRQVGAQLSGGLDSGSVVSFAAKALREQHKKLYTFSFVPISEANAKLPRNRIADETPFIRTTVQHVGNIEAMYLDFDGSSPLSEIDRWLDMAEIPYKVIENSYWIRGIFERASEQGVGVLLSGGRGNFTISWGPALSYYAMLLKRMRWIRLYKEIRSYSRNVGTRESRVFQDVRRRALGQLRLSKNDFAHPVPRIIHPQLAAKTGIDAKLRSLGIDPGGFHQPLSMYEARRRHFEQPSSWHTSGLMATKLSLNYKVWHRDPTNDQRVVRFCLSVPEEQYVRNGMDRALIRRATRSLLPDPIRLNQTVRGIQGADGVRRMSGDWRLFLKELKELSSDSAMAEYVNVPVLLENVERWNNGLPDNPFDTSLNVLMRSLILYRFVKRYA
nr:asparagine synthase-related protein [Cohnella lubricantis]